MQFPKEPKSDMKLFSLLGRYNAVLDFYDF